LLVDLFAASKSGAKRERKRERKASAAASSPAPALLLAKNNHWNDLLASSLFNDIVHNILNLGHQLTRPLAFELSDFPSGPLPQVDDLVFAHGI